MILFCQAEGSNAALFTFAAYTFVVFMLAIVASRMQKGRGFLSEYFLGSRSLGTWAFALTFAATSASGGSFTGFPSLIYSHGWSLALWIGSYMLVPVIAMGLLGKRLNQMARQAGAITIPDVLSARFGSPRVGLLSTVIIISFLTLNLVPQFKAGSVMLSTLLDDNPLFSQSVASFGSVSGVADPKYVLCLLVFAFAVIVYTSYGGFRAVVWTDVLQGIVMVLGVVILLPMTLYHVGGLESATQDLAKMVPPLPCRIVLETNETGYELGDWVTITEGEGNARIFRLGKLSKLDKTQPADQAMIDQNVTPIDAIEILSPHEVARLLDSDIARNDLQIRSISNQKPYLRGHQEPGTYISAPGPSPKSELGFLPIGVAVSFFFYWTFSGAGQPSNMVRLMSFNSSLTLRRAIITVAIYFSLIYFPLVIIFCCARVLMPGMETESDRIMPALVEHVTRLSGVPWLAGLLVAAPFAAVMSTVDSFLLMISSAIVRDVYQQRMNPQATERQMKRLTYIVTACVGVVAVAGAFYPPKYLQDIIVFTGGGLTACFLVPVTLALYWPRFNASGAVAGMLAGYLAHVALHGMKYFGFMWLANLGIDPFLPVVAISMLASVVASLSTRPPNAEIVRRFFC